MIWKNFKEGFIEGRDLFSSLTSRIVNSIILSIVYFAGIGLTSFFAKLSKKKFLDTEKINGDTYWEELNLEKKEDQYYLRQF